MGEPIIGQKYTAKEIKANGWNPCLSCKHSNRNGGIGLACQDHCIWAYWSNGNRENTEYRWNGSKDKDGFPIFSDSTWDRVD